MKLRLRGNSLRIRLTQSEVAAVCDQGSWQETTELGLPGSGSLIYKVEATADGDATVLYTGGAETVVSVVLPVAEVKRWGSSSEVGVYFDTSWGLKVAVEKDFRCLDPNREEDESDNYANPNDAESHHAACHAEDD